jgi:predicted DNA-binding transcriptional regulator YafY
MARRPSDDAVRRLLALVPLLARGGAHSLSDLARTLGTDAATIAADLETLSTCGADERDPSTNIAVYVEGDRAVVFGEMPALGTAVRLTAAEVRAVRAALELCGDAPDSGLAAKLDAIAVHRGREAGGGTVGISATPGDSAHTYALLAACAAAHRVARLSYLPYGEREVQARLVQPWRLFLERGVWYVHLLSESSGEERTYRLDRVLAAEATGRAFTPPTPQPPVPVVVPDPATARVADVLFAHAGFDLNGRDWPGAVFDRRDDGTVLARIPYSGTRWIARKVTAWLGDATVLDPREVRDAVIAVATSESCAGCGAHEGK